MYRNDLSIHIKVMSYSYAVNNSDPAELYRFTDGEDTFEFVYDGHGYYDWKSGHPWRERFSRPVPDTSILLRRGQLD